MVDRSSAVAKYTWCIMGPSSSINSNCNWSALKSVLNSSASIGFGNSTYVEISSLFLTSSSHSFVWICSLRCDSMIFDVIQSQMTRSAVAAMISIRSWTINQLLFWKICSFFRKQSPWLARSNCCKSPTWSTRSLILNSGYTTFCGPIYFNIRWRELLNSDFTWKMMNFDLP